MSTERPTSVTGYLRAQPAAARTTLQQVRRAIRRALPDAEEVLSYGMPTYKLSSRAVIYFAAWRNHYSIYPAGDRLAAAFRSELAPYRRVKSTLQFPYDRPAPARLIERLVRFRVTELKPRPRPPLPSPKKTAADR
jgi:uncharacterized protein YdhG (YjbR/CyaY superfamily)